MKRAILFLVILVSGLIFAQTGQLQPIKPSIPFTPLLTTTIKESQLIGLYGSAWKIYWDGWEGTLVLLKGGKGYIEVSGTRYDLEYVILKNPQDNIAGMTGPGYTGKTPTWVIVSSSWLISPERRPTSLTINASMVMFSPRRSMSMASRR